MASCVRDTHEHTVTVVKREDTLFFYQENKTFLVPHMNIPIIEVPYQQYHFTLTPEKVRQKKNRGEYDSSFSTCNSLYPREMQDSIF